MLGVSKRKIEELEEKIERKINDLRQYVTSVQERFESFKQGFKQEYEQDKQDLAARIDLLQENFAEQYQRLEQELQELKTSYEKTIPEINIEVDIKNETSLEQALQELTKNVEDIAYKALFERAVQEVINLGYELTGTEVQGGVGRELNHGAIRIYVNVKKDGYLPLQRSYDLTPEQLEQILEEVNSNEARGWAIAHIYHSQWSSADFTIEYNPGDNLGRKLASEVLTLRDFFFYGVFKKMLDDYDGLNPGDKERLASFHLKTVFEYLQPRLKVNKQLKTLVMQDLLKKMSENSEFATDFTRYGLKDLVINQTSIEQEKQVKKSKPRKRKARKK